MLTPRRSESPGGSASHTNAATDSSIPAKISSTWSAVWATAPPAATAAVSTNPICTATSVTRVGPTGMRATANDVTSHVHHSIVNVKATHIPLSSV